MEKTIIFKIFLIKDKLNYIHFIYKNKSMGIGDWGLGIRD